MVCLNCNLCEFCLFYGLNLEELECFDDFVLIWCCIKWGDYFYCVGEVFDSIYVICSGFFKIDVLFEDGCE